MTWRGLVTGDIPEEEEEELLRDDDIEDSFCSEGVEEGVKESLCDDTELLREPTGDRVMDLLISRGSSKSSTISMKGCLP